MTAKVYACLFCGKAYKDTKRLLKHEDTCLSNRSNRIAAQGQNPVAPGGEV
jgi:hypothetical protein